MFRKFMVLAAFAVALGLHAGLASASTLHPVIPGGLPKNNINAAVSDIKQRAGFDPAFAATIARNAGASRFVESQYEPAGYHKGAPNTVNTGSDTGGNIDKSQDTKECNSKTSLMAVMINIVTHIKVYVCTACANPRVYSSRPAPKRVWAPFSKGTYVKYHKTKSQLMKITCPSGQEVTARVVATINGVLHAKVYGKVSGILNARLQAAFTGQLKVKTTLTCGAAPKAPATPSVVCSNINSPGASACDTTYITVTCGIFQAVIGGSSVQDATSKAQAWANQFCVTPPAYSPPCTSNCTPSHPTPQCTHDCSPPPKCAANQTWDSGSGKCLNKKTDSVPTPNPNAQGQTTSGNSTATNPNPQPTDADGDPQAGASNSNVPTDPDGNVAPPQ